MSYELTWKNRNLRDKCYARRGTHGRYFYINKLGSYEGIRLGIRIGNYEGIRFKKIRRALARKYKHVRTKHY